MRIVTINGWEASAETEIEKRIAISLRRLGHECVNVRTSQEINRLNPDLVISLSYHFAKLTDHPTVLALWSPVTIILSRADFVKNLLSFDGYLYTNQRLKQQLEDVCFSANKDFHGIPFHASVHATPFEPADFANARLVYAGTNWESRARVRASRYQDWLTTLRESESITICGPSDRWGGDERVITDIPFDGESMLKTYREFGVVLALHSRFHREEDLPTVRPFEAAAAGCLPIIDKLKFYEREFGEDAFFIDPNLSAEEAQDHINSIVQWVRNNPEEAKQRAERIHKRFVSKFSYDAELANLEDLLQKVRKSSYFDIPKRLRAADKVTYIVRCGGRSSELLRRCLQSLAAQTAGAPNILLVKHGRVDELDDILEWASSAFPSIELMELHREGPKSIRLWAALHNVKTPYFALLDDDDTVHATHVASLLDMAIGDDESVLWYSGTIRCWEGVDFAGRGEWKKHSSWPSTDHHTDEERYITLFEDHDPQQLWTRNYVASPSYIARTSSLRDKAGIDPEIGTAEDWTLVALLARQGPFRFSYRATAEWYWRKSMSENASFGKQGRRWLNLQRIKARTDTSRMLQQGYGYKLENVNYPNQTYRDVEFLRDLPAEVPSGGWYALEQVSDTIALIHGEAEFDGLDYNQKFRVHHDQAYELAALKVHCVREQALSASHEVDEQTQSLPRNGSFRKFVIKLGTPSPLECENDELSLITSDDTFGEKKLTKLQLHDAPFELSCLQRKILAGETGNDWLPFEQDELTLGRNIEKDTDIYGINPKYHARSKFDQSLKITFNHYAVKQHYIAFAAICFLTSQSVRSVAIKLSSEPAKSDMKMFDHELPENMKADGWFAVSLRSLAQNRSRIRKRRSMNDACALLALVDSIIGDQNIVSFRLKQGARKYLKEFGRGLPGVDLDDENGPLEKSISTFGHYHNEEVEQILLSIPSFDTDDGRYFDLMARVQLLQSGYFLRLELSRFPFFDLAEAGGRRETLNDKEFVVLSLERLISEFRPSPSSDFEVGTDTERLLQFMLFHLFFKEMSPETQSQPCKYIHQMRDALSSAMVPITPGLVLSGYRHGDDFEQVHFTVSKSDEVEEDEYAWSGLIQKMTSGYFIRLALKQFPNFDLELTGGQAINSNGENQLVLSVERLLREFGLPRSAQFEETNDTKRVLLTIIGRLFSTQIETVGATPAQLFVNEMQDQLSGAIQISETGLRLSGYHAGASFQQVHFRIRRPHAESSGIPELTGQIQNLPSGCFLKLNVQDHPYWDIKVSGGSISHQQDKSFVMLPLSRLDVGETDASEELSDNLTTIAMADLLEHLVIRDIPSNTGDNAVQFLRAMRESLDSA